MTNASIRVLAVFSGSPRPRVAAGRSHPGVGEQHGAELFELDAMSPDLHLAVQPTKMVELTVRPQTAAVPAAVDTITGHRIDHEALRGKARTLQVVQGYARATYPDLSFDTQCNQAS